MLGNWGKLHERRIGIMLHYDGSTSDAGALTWLLRDPACHVSYNDIVTDDGKIVAVAPRSARAWHAGVCKPSSLFKYKDANSAFYGLAVSCGSNDTATPKQVDGVIRACLELFAINGWKSKDVWRITDHEAEAWPRGRKIDIFGDRKKRKTPVLDIVAIREAVRLELEKP